MARHRLEKAARSALAMAMGKSNVTPRMELGCGCGGEEEGKERKEVQRVRSASLPFLFAIVGELRRVFSLSHALSIASVVRTCAHFHLLWVWQGRVPPRPAGRILIPASRAWGCCCQPLLIVISPLLCSIVDKRVLRANAMRCDALIEYPMGWRCVVCSS